MKIVNLASKYQTNYIPIWIDKINFVFFIILCLFLSLGKALVEIFSQLIIFFWLCKKIFSHKYKVWRYLPKTKLDLPIIVFLGACFLTLISSSAPVETLRGCGSKWFQYLFLYFATVDIINTSKKFKKIWATLCISAFIIGIDGIIQFIFSRDFFRRYPLEEGLWIRATFKNLNTLGAYLNITIPLVFTYIFVYLHGKSIKEIGGFLCLGILFFCLIWSHSIQSWIGLILGLLFSSFLKERERKKIIFRIILFSVIFFGIIWSIPWGKERIKSAFTLKKVKSRTQFWIPAFEVVKSSPLLGKGINTTRSSIISRYSNSEILIKYAHTHSLYIKILLEGGIIGLGTFLWVLFSVIKSYIWLRRDWIIFGFATSFFSFLIVNISDTFFSTRMQCLFWILIGLIVSYVRLSERN